MQDLIDRLQAAKRKPSTSWCVFDFPAKEAQLQELQKTIRRARPVE